MSVGDTVATSVPLARFEFTTTLKVRVLDGVTAPARTMSR